MSQRFEMRLSDELAGRIDRARGDVPRATWIKRAVEKALEQGLSTGEAAADGPVPASPRSSKPKGNPSVAETWRR